MMRNGFPHRPPHRTPEEYAEQVFGLTADRRQTWTGTWTYRRVAKDWETGGLVTSWVEKQIESPSVERCVHKRALVRGDGKILTPVEVKHVDDCTDSAGFYARQINGQLVGVDSLGMYEY